MGDWSRIEEVEQEFARRARALFDAGRHKTMARIRRDGSPRISGIELTFLDGEVVVGMDPGSVKAHDLERDNRVAIHSPSPDPPEGDPSGWPGDAKLAGRAIPVHDPEEPDQPPSRYRIDVEEVVITKVGTPADHLLIESWNARRGYRSVKRR